MLPTSSAFITFLFLSTSAFLIQILIFSPISPDYLELPPLLQPSEFPSNNILKLLNPNPEVMSKLITENGFVEDQFGLGLIVRAVQEGIAVIKPTGIIIFNIGGRPGQGVCRCLFERRGFRITQLWQTKIMQVKIIFDFLKNGFQEVGSSLDLSFDDDSVADEKIPFLAYLATVLKENTFFIKDPPAGSTRFHNLISIFMKIYHNVPLSADGLDLSL